MGTCFITRRGGGTSKAFAVIGVSYPAGSICTCTDGTKTLKLKNTSGQGLFIIPYAATWSVTATDGTNTKSESVEITSEGQSVSVTLLYAVYYYNNGDINSLTGGWNNATVGTALSARIDVASSGYAQTLTVSSNNTIDLTEINTIYVVGTMTASDRYANTEFTIGGASTSVSGEINQTNTKTDFSLDVSSVSSGKFTFNLMSGSGYSSINITKIYGE